MPYKLDQSSWSYGFITQERRWHSQCSVQCKHYVHLGITMEVYIFRHCTYYIGWCLMHSMKCRVLRGWVPRLLEDTLYMQNFCMWVEQCNDITLMYMKILLCLPAKGVQQCGDITKCKGHVKTLCLLAKGVQHEIIL